MSKLLKRRLRALEAISGDSDNSPAAIFLDVVDASEGGGPLPESDLIGLQGGEVCVLRLPGESLPDMDGRVVVDFPPPNAGAFPPPVRVWTRLYRKREVGG